MRTMRWVRRRLLSPLTFALLLCLGGCALMPHRALAQGSNDALALVPKLLDVLDRDGFTVQRGAAAHYDTFQRVCAGLTQTGRYNNVGAPYLTLALPAAPEEAGQLSVVADFRLRTDEAVLIVGRTPPPAAYFSYQTFLDARWNEQSAGPFRPYDELFAYLGDTVNSMTIQTTGGPDPYNRPLALLITGHRKTQERLRAALLAAGYPAAAINTEVLAPSLARFGYRRTADLFTFLHRVAIPQPGSEQAVQDYIDHPPLAVFRVRPKVEFAPDPLDAPVLRPRGSGRTEMDLFPAIEKVRRAVLEACGAGLRATELDTSLPFDEGYPAVQRGVAWIPGVVDGSVGLTRDTVYLATPWFDLPEDGFAIAYGVNHAATGKATYSSLTVYLDPVLQFGVATAQSPQFYGTATRYLPDDPASGRLYVWKVARHCNGEPNCVEARPNGPCAAVSPDAKVRIVFRAYAEPATKAGPDHVELLYDRVIVFTR